VQVCSQARLLPSIQLRLLSGNVSAMEPPVPPSCKLSGADSDSGLHFHRSQSVHLHRSITKTTFIHHMMSIGIYGHFLRPKRVLDAPSMPLCVSSRLCDYATI